MWRTVVRDGTHHSSIHQDSNPMRMSIAQKENV